MPDSSKPTSPSSVAQQGPQQGPQQEQQTPFPRSEDAFDGGQQQGDPTPAGATPGSAVQGEGDYEAARRHRESAERFVESGAVPSAARSAAPASAEEAEALEDAEAAGRKPARH